MSVINDVITREMTLDFPVERVWQAITDPAEVRQWFGDQSVYELREGGTGVHKWGDNAHRMRIVTLEPPHRYVYEWVVEQYDDESRPFDEMQTTRVEYRLESIPQGTRLFLTESGFASHPRDKRESNYADNSEGWASELAKLPVFLARAA
ncbi:MAG: SRPBCC domain-containing protein [Thermomicrobiales bacterium]